MLTHTGEFLLSVGGSSIGSFVGLLHIAAGLLTWSRSLESLLFTFTSMAVLIAAYMGLRDDRRRPGTPQRSPFRTFDYDSLRPGNDDAQERLGPSGGGPTR